MMVMVLLLAMTRAVVTHHWLLLGGSGLGAALRRLQALKLSRKPFSPRKNTGDLPGAEFRVVAPALPPPPPRKAWYPQTGPVVWVGLNKTPKPLKP